MNNKFEILKVHTGHFSNEFAEMFNKYWWEGGEVTGDIRDTARVTYTRAVDKQIPEVGLLMAHDGNGTFVGFCVMMFQYHTASVEKVVYIADLYVEEEYRRNGIARQFIKEVEAIAKEQDLFRIYWVTRAENQRAQALYDSVASRMTHVWYEIPLKEIPCHPRTE